MQFSAKSSHKRLTQGNVTLSVAKDLSRRFFALLRMTILMSRIVMCTNIMWFDLVNMDGAT